MKLKCVRVCRSKALNIGRQPLCIHCYSFRTNNDYYSNIYCNRKQLKFHHILSSFIVRCVRCSVLSLMEPKEKHKKYHGTLGNAMMVSDYQRRMPHFFTFSYSMWAFALCVFSQEKKSFEHIHFIKFEFNIKMANDLLELECHSNFAKWKH